MEKGIIAIIQARLGSTRFKNKILKKIGDKTIVEFLYKRISSIKNIKKTIIATTKSKIDDELYNFLKKKNINVFRGSESNVLKRFYEVSKLNTSDYIIRICCDCPFIDLNILKKMINKAKEKELDYISNTIKPTFPDGLDVEIFKTKILKKAYFNTSNKYDKEHVTPYIIRNAIKKENFEFKKDLSNYRLTIDEPNDYKVIIKTYKLLKNKEINIQNIDKIIMTNHKLFKLNRNDKRNEGAIMNKGQKLWKKAKSLIPGGNMLLSKRPEMFLPDKWPTYFSKSKGCYVWDLENKKYIDLSTMSVGTNILGYSNEKINLAVKKSIDKGNMTSLNCPEEVELAERLLSIHPWFDMVRFAKTGGESNSIAIRIARAYCGKDNIAICGYHGWHDWYLSANLKSKNKLNNHLLPGLSSVGVPKKLTDTTFPFEYNNFKEFKNVCKKNKIGIVKMEVFRNIEPKDNFLKKIRQYCTKNKIVLNFDECTSGFREAFGALHKKYNVKPDICILGKALGNGYPITVVMGKKRIMNRAQNTFISSTFWTERTGYIAALKTLEIMEKEKSWDKISKLGKLIKKQWLELSKKHEISLEVFGLDAIPLFTINSKHWLKYKTYITSELLKKNILGSNVIYLSTAHNLKILKKYFYLLDKIFFDISNFEKNLDRFKLVNLKVCHSGFKRLN